MALRQSRVAVSAAFGCQGLLFAVLVTHLPAFKDREHLDDAAVTLVLLGVTVLAGAGSVLAGSAAARSGSPRVLATALLAEVVAVLDIAVLPGLVPFCLGFAGYGLAVGAVDASSNMQAVALEHRYRRSILTSFHAAWSAAGIAGALWTTLADRLAVPLGPALLAAAAAVAVVVAGTARRYLGGPDRDDAPGDRRLGSIPRRALWLLGLAMALFYVADSGISSWSSIYLRDTLAVSTGTAALGYAGYQATSVLARLGGDQAVRRWGAAAVVRVGAGIGVSGLLVAVLAPRPWIAIAGFTLVGLGLPVVAPLCFAAAGRLAPGNADAVIAQVNIFNYVGALAGGVLVGGIGTAVGLRLAFVLPLILAAWVIVLAPAFEVARAPRVAA